MAARYIPYITLREKFSNVYRKSRNLPKTIKTAKFTDDVIREVIITPDFSQSLAAGILIDEEEYVRESAHVYFPADSNLLEMLWKARMEVSLSDIAEFPRAFSIAWPDDFNMFGSKLSGCLVWWGTEKQRREIHNQFGSKYVGHDVVRWNPKPYVRNDHDRLLCLSYHGPDAESSFGFSSFRCVVPEEKLKICLRSHDEMMESIGELGALMTMKLTDEEKRFQFCMLKLVVHLMVYATACPDAILPGWPDKYHEHDVGTGWLNKYHPIRLLSPVVSHTGTSPRTHWRTWTFRRYPLRADNSRQKGLVFVSGCIVNGNVEPKTIIHTKSSF